MGCLNSNKNFKHKFGNIHLSGPCNRSCYFCIGQHMMALDPYNNLDEWPLAGLSEFISTCNDSGINEVNLTGTNTDPLLYQHCPELITTLKEGLPDLVMGLRTNGVLALSRPDIVNLFNKMSISICATNREDNIRIMGGPPADIKKILSKFNIPIKVNVILSPEANPYETITDLEKAGVTAINLREPYGQPRLGDPLEFITNNPTSKIFGMPQYKWGNALVTYWDVHYVEVESVNLYVTGRISHDYPITLGHDKSGEVKDQSYFKQGRQIEQWRG